MARTLRAIFVATVVVGCASAPIPSRREQIEQFIISVDACMPESFATRPNLLPESLNGWSTIIASGDRRGLLAEIECVAAAGSDCERVRACYGLETSATAGACNGVRPRCEGDTLVQCVPASTFSPTQIWRLDCAHDGLVCLEGEDAAGIRQAACALGRCTFDSPIRCQGDAMVGCNGLFEIPNLPNPNMTCRMIGLTGVEFVNDGAPCEASGCLGDHAIDCQGSRVVNDVDCGSIDRGCREFEGTAWCQSLDAASCMGAIPTCDGDVLRFCGSDQRMHDYDCRAHGFAGCERRESPIVGSFVGCAPVGPRF